MIDGQFDVVFRGQTIKSMQEDEVKANLMTLFKSTPEAIDKLFSGNEMSIKKSLDYGTAMKYQSALKKAGALALIKEVSGEAPNEASSDIVSTESSTAEQETDSFKTNEPKSSMIEESSKANSSSTFVASHQSTPSIDQSLQPHEKAEEAALIEDEDNMTLAAVGTAIMPDKIYEKRDVDTSEFSLAAAGERLLPEKAPENHPQPSIDHLKLEN